MHHHAWELYRLGWVAYDALNVARGNLWAVIPLMLGVFGFVLYRRRGRGRRGGKR